MSNGKLQFVIKSGFAHFLEMSVELRGVRSQKTFESIPAVL